MARRNISDGTGSFGADVANALTNGGVWVGTLRSSTISFDSVKFELNANRPVMARWAWSGTAVGHVLVIRGFNDTGSALSFIDPEKSSYQVASYSAFVSSGTRSWTQTRDGIS